MLVILYVLLVLWHGSSFAIFWLVFFFYVVLNKFLYLSLSNLMNGIQNGWLIGMRMDDFSLLWLFGSWENEGKKKVECNEIFMTLDFSPSESLRNCVLGCFHVAVSILFDQFFMICRVDCLKGFCWLSVWLLSKLW